MGLYEFYIYSSSEHCRWNSQICTLTYVCISLSCGKWNVMFVVVSYSGTVIVLPRHRLQLINFIAWFICLEMIKISLTFVSMVSELNVKMSSEVFWYMKTKNQWSLFVVCVLEIITSASSIVFLYQNASSCIANDFTSKLSFCKYYWDILCSFSGL